MSDVIDDGGTAFPYPTQGGRMCGGMSLRDYFAGQSLPGLLADPDISRFPYAIAEKAYAYADAMIATRASNQANARLIAAAPDLLELLRKMVTAYESLPGAQTAPGSWHSHALAAIAAVGDVEVIRA